MSRGWLLAFSVTFITKETPKLLRVNPVPPLSRLSEEMKDIFVSLGIESAGDGVTSPFPPPKFPAFLPKQNLTEYQGGGFVYLWFPLLRFVQ